MASRIVKETFPGLASTNVTAITWTGNPPTYSSGGIAQGVVVTLDAADGTEGAVKVAGTTDIPLGIADVFPAAAPAEPVLVQTGGVARVKAHAAITIGSQVVIGAADGTVSAATTGAATSQYVVGIALQAAAQAGDYITVRLTPGGTTSVAS